MKKLITILLLCAIILATYLFYKRSKEPEVIAPGTEQEEGRYMDIETYVKQNIRTLSPLKETVGGTFYVTEIESDGGTGTVEYEDGHNAYTADFTYIVDANGKPTIDTFVIR